MLFVGLFNQILRDLMYFISVVFLSKAVSEVSCCSCLFFFSDSVC